MRAAIKTDVVIIGAGPTGLALACQFVRFGVDFVILEKNEGITPYSKALGVQARTLEIYEQLGLAQKAVERGEIAGKIRLLADGEVRGEVDLSNIGQGSSPYPYMLILEQSKNEQLLYEYLQSHRKDVLWESKLESFSQVETGVTAQVKTADGASQIIKAKYLVGCDGAKSPVRSALGLTFEGSTFERLFYVADAQIDWQFSHDAGYGCLARNEMVAFLPMEGKKRYRVIGTFPEGMDKDEGEILYEEIEQRIKEDTKLSLDIYNVNWFSVYKVHTRRVNRFSVDRCFLAGDSAHIHSPAGGQGMNTGIQDAYNLAWKLALVLKGYASESLLETYNEERLENATRLLETTDKIFEVQAGSDWLWGFVRTTIFPPLAKYILSLDVVKRKFFLLISQISINYRHSSLSNHAGDENFEVKAGDRMPYFSIDGEGVYNKLRQPKFHLLVFSDAQSDVQALKTELKNQNAELVDFNAFPIDPRVAEVFGANNSFNVLLRPDNHIGFISTGNPLSELRAYLNEFVGRS